MPDRFWLLNETGVESTDWRSKGAEVGGGESKVWKSSCVEGDRAKAQGSLETCPVMWRNLEPHISVHANWQVGDFCFLHGSSQGAGGEEAGGKATQVRGWAGREGWEDTGTRGQGGCPSREAGTGVGSSDQATPLPHQVLARLPADLATKTRPRALEKVTPGIPGPEQTLRESYLQSSAYLAKWLLNHPEQVGNKDQPESTCPLT